mmetsp:Transcript_15571/g.26952  ORF Transcript_15571/g.26952 Transcript_15571/m.26952 type:complete len:83 (+) Transcript_15571:93-341(+)
MALLPIAVAEFIPMHAARGRFALCREEVFTRSSVVAQLAASRSAASNQAKVLLVAKVDGVTKGEVESVVNALHIRSESKVPL